jgi:DNA-directed RNA polymerase subunit beta'
MPRAIDLLVDEIIPADLRPGLSDMSTGNVNDFLVNLYKTYPDKYKDVSHALGKLGAKAAYVQGETIGLEDFDPVVDKENLLTNMREEVAQARKIFKNKDEFKKAREAIWVKYNDLMIKNTVSGAKATYNKIGLSVLSGARGKTPQLQAMLTTPGIYADSRGEIVPMFVENSFADGLRPTEYAAGMFGARASVISTKSATAKGGDYGKLLSQASSRLLVTDDDCGVDNGVAYDVDDNTPNNRLLSKSVGGYEAGTLLTRQVLADLKKQNIKKVVARSPLTCNADGLCSKCVGKTFEDKFPKVGEHVGITSANALSEPVTQGALSAKHTGGQAVQRGEYGGFEILSQFVQSPKEYKHKSITSDEEGQISQIEDAPQGGWNVFVNNKPYYVRPEYPLTVKVGDYVEAGAPISEGIIDARDVVEKVGLGAGRKYWSDRLQKIYKDSGLYADKKNIEIVARGALDTVNIEEDIDGIDAYVDDTVNYNKLKKAWKPTASTKLSTDMAKNKYLAKDTLHHTIGTKITPTIQKEFNEVGINEIETLEKAPPFKPNMDRLRTVSHYNDDWLAGLSTSYLKKQLEESTLRAATTDIASNQHWAPRVAVGVGFGQNIEQTGKF